MSEREPTRSEVTALLVRWELAEFSAQEVHESAELLRDDAPDTGSWPGVDYEAPRWGLRAVLGFLSDLAAAPYFKDDIPAFRSLLNTEISGAARNARWLEYHHQIDWDARGRRAAKLAYYNLWHRL